MGGSVLARPAGSALPFLFALLSGAVLLPTLLGGCAATPTHPSESGAAAPILARAQSVDALLLGEQHDAPDHPDIHRQVVAGLATRGRLAGLVIEMAERGADTQALPVGAAEDGVRQALRWDDKAWPWARYGPAVMAAVRAGVVVAGGNLPRDRMRPVMADTSMDLRLPGAELARQREAIRAGHCDLLPAGQIAPMTRIQLARDIAMAQSVAELARPGRVVVLLAGAAHVERASGVPAHLPASLHVLAVLLAPQQAGASEGRYDLHLATSTYTAQDHCAALRRQLAPAPRSP